MIKLFGLFVCHEADDKFGFSKSSSSFLICASSDFELLNDYCQTLQKSADLLSSLMPTRGHSVYRVDEINLLDL